MKALIREIFPSIQGEGLYVGEKQLFIRFSGCNLKCKFCDTDFSKQNSKEYSVNDLFNYVENFDIETLSLTGGEPLLYKDFLNEFLPLINRNIHLETNGTLYKELKEIEPFIDVIAMDIKLESATGEKNRFEDNKKFLDVAPYKTFIKVVVDKNIKDDEIKNVCDISNGVPIILQPVMPLQKDCDFETIFEKFYTFNKNVRLIPQTHKFLNIP